MPTTCSEREATVRRKIEEAVRALDELVSLLSTSESDETLLSLAVAVVELEYAARHRPSLDLLEVRRAAEAVVRALPPAAFAAPATGAR